MPRQAVIVAANLALLEQAFELIGRTPESTYAGVRNGPRPVGPQFRHVLDHYRRFLSGLESARIDYDDRERDPALETDRRAARRTIRELIGDLSLLDGERLDLASEARLECGLGAEEDQWSRTTLRRELHFLLSHTIHHYALIGLLLAEHGVDPGADFGVAPSTLSYWRSQPKCVPQPG
jgi:hypothetical protein